MRVRLAEARPASVRVNLNAAAALVDDGNMAAARRYAARAEAMVPSDTVGTNAVDWAEAQLFRAYLDWYEDKPGESLGRVNRLAVAIDRSDQLRTTIANRLIYLYLAFGRLQAAQNLAERSRVWEGCCLRTFWLTH